MFRPNPAQSAARPPVVLTVAPPEQGYSIADTIHNTGQAIVWSGQLETAEHYWEQLKDAGLTMAPLEQG